MTGMISSMLDKVLNDKIGLFYHCLALARLFLSHLVFVRKRRFESDSFVKDGGPISVFRNGFCERRRDLGCEY